MAIIVEEEKSRGGIIKLVMWMGLLVIIAVAVYYIFFAQPQVVEFAIPPAFVNINPIAAVSVNQEDVINSPAFQALKPYVTIPTPTTNGRTNPFLAP